MQAGRRRGAPQARLNARCFQQTHSSRALGPRLDSSLTYTAVWIPRLSSRTKFHFEAGHTLQWGFGSSSRDFASFGWPFPSMKSGHPHLWQPHSVRLFGYGKGSCRLVLSPTLETFCKWSLWVLLLVVICSRPRWKGDKISHNQLDAHLTASSYSREN